MGEVHGTKEIFLHWRCFAGMPVTPPASAPVPPALRVGHKQNPAIISILEIALCAELTIAHRLIEGLINNLT